MEIVVTVDSYVFHAYQNYYCKDFLYLWAEEKYTLELFMNANSIGDCVHKQHEVEQLSIAYKWRNK